MDMVEQQIKGRGITDEKILEAFRRVERKRFVPEEHKALSYHDRPLPIGKGQTISQPYIVAYMTNILKLSGSDRVLEIGTGSGYQTGILGELCGEIYSIEIIESLGKRAIEVLDELGYTNISVKIGDGFTGWGEHAPYDVIIATCAPTTIPGPLKLQLKEGGRMVIPVGNPNSQKLVLLRKKDGLLKEVDTLSVRFVPMVNSDGSKY